MSEDKPTFDDLLADLDAAETHGAGLRHVLNYLHGKVMNATSDFPNDVQDDIDAAFSEVLTRSQAISDALHSKEA